MIRAQLVFDGSKAPVIPDSMLENGHVYEDQMNGTWLECLGEIASRICYNSFGYDQKTLKRKGRSSSALHAHILDVDNTSVYEHCNFTIRLVPNNDHLAILSALANRKGIFVELVGGGLEITTNFRAIKKWDRCSTAINLFAGDTNIALRETLTTFGHLNASQIFPNIGKSGEEGLVKYGAKFKISNLTDDQAWISIYLHGSRGMTHEQVRHRFAMSQRSTRYVDESESAFLWHPLVNQLIADDRRYLKSILEACDYMCRKTYRQVASSLQDFLEKRGADGTNARKQARGAARGFLPNNLESEMIYSAPVSGWKWILKNRASIFADAEIRLVYNEVLEELKKSQYSDRFANYNLIPSPDGIGHVLDLDPFA